MYKTKFYNIYTTNILIFNSEYHIINIVDYVLKTAVCHNASMSCVIKL